MNRAGMEKLRPGDLMFSNTSGAVGVFITFAEWLLEQTEPDEYGIDHVAVVTDRLPHIVHAQPTGAREDVLDPERYWTPSTVYVRPLYEIRSLEDICGGEWDQGSAVANAAEEYIGTPYSFADYAAILGLHAGIRNGPIRRYVTSSEHMICSQLADQALSDAGLHVFTDGRLPQDVMPVELFRALIARKGTLIFRPGWTDWRSPPKL